MTRNSFSPSEPLETNPPCAVVISPQRELRRSVLDALAGCAQIVDCSDAAVYPCRDAVLHYQPRVCFIDVGTSDQALTLVHELAGAGVPVAALHLNNDSDLILRSFRCGASEFLFEPIAPGDLLEAFQRLLRKSGAGSAEHQRGKIWALMPAKPNYGATTISCNLAVRIRQHLGRPVLLADLDPCLGSVGFALKLKSAFSFIDVVNHEASIDKDLWRKIIVAYEGVDVLLGPEIPRFETPSPSGLPSFLEFVRLNYSDAVMDNPGPLSDWYLAVARHADEILLVTTNELAGVHAAARTIQLLERAGAERNRIRLVVNRYEKENGLVQEAIETALKFKVYWTLPNDYVPVQKALLDGKMVPSNCRLGEALDRLVLSLTGTGSLQRKRWAPSFAKLFRRAG
jgi:Flp pilus assembly CpaE family ATPase